MEAAPASQAGGEREVDGDGGEELELPDVLVLGALAPVRVLLGEEVIGREEPLPRRRLGAAEPQRPVRGGG